MATVSISDCSWPTLSETTVSSPSKNDGMGDSSFDWEFVSPDDHERGETHTATTTSPSSSHSRNSRKKVLKHCASSPNFGDYVMFDDATVTSVMTTDSGTNSSGGGVVIVPPSPTPTDKTTVTVRRVPSFKDAILLNAEEKAKEAQALKDKKETTATVVRRGRIRRATYVVKPIQRRSVSMCDLQNLNSINEHGCDAVGACDGYGGGGGGSCDAPEYYDRKEHGFNAKQNGKKLRPDEAKRKEMIIHKRNEQRLRQAQAVK